MKGLLLAVLLLGATVQAEANDYTDIWYEASQPGYGFNLIQSHQFIFATFFVYGPGGQPTWLVAGLDWNGAGSYTGNLYTAVGTFYGAPWNPANYAPTQVGTASFTPSPSNNWQGTLSYNVQSGPGAPASATVHIERQTLTAIPTGGIYAGAQVGNYAGCNNPANNGSAVDHYELLVIENANASVTYQFRYQSGITCTLAGVYAPHGQYLEVGNAGYSCTDGVNTTANIRQIKVSDLGIEGIIQAPTVGDNCSLTAKFGGPSL